MIIILYTEGTVSKTDGTTSIWCGNVNTKLQQHGSAPFLEWLNMSLCYVLVLSLIDLNVKYTFKPLCMEVLSELLPKNKSTQQKLYSIFRQVSDEIWENSVAMSYWPYAKMAALQLFFCLYSK